MAPAELEEIIRVFPNVSEAAVVGIPHKTLGEVPRAFVVPQKGTSINKEALIEYVKGQVASYKQLAGGVSIVDNIPKNITGKMLKRELKLEYLKTIA